MCSNPGKIKLGVHSSSVLEPKISVSVPFVLEQEQDVTGEGIVALYAAPNTVLLNKICLNQDITGLCQSILSAIQLKPSCNQSNTPPSKRPFELWKW